MEFRIIDKDTLSHARLGEIKTGRGIIQTPVFMPVGTTGSVKAVQHRELTADIKAEIILGNTYHLYLRPGMDVLQKAGGFHSFTGWEYPVLTDSGGYQVYSLSDNRKIHEDGVSFKSHIDGSTHFFSPENVIDMQRVIGADIVMAFDECTPYPCDYGYAGRSMNLTHRWLDRCVSRFRETEPRWSKPQYLFGIVQGSIYQDLRKSSASYIADQDLDGNAIGGLSVGEPAGEMYEITQKVCEILPADRPRYLMGVGTPENLLESISMGVDMFDCVMPTRNGRNGMVFTTQGMINLRNEKWKEDFSPIDPGINRYPGSCFTRAYLRHLIMSKEILGAQIASLQNLSFYAWLIQSARTHIADGTFAAWKNKIREDINRKL